jgi:hypothetical protein
MDGNARAPSHDNTAQTPSARIIAEATEMFSVTDATGRCITMKRRRDRDRDRAARQCRHRRGRRRAPAERCAGTPRGKLSRHPALVDCLYLVRHGVPFDVAFSLADEERTEWVVAIGELDGRRFDWTTRQWSVPGGHAFAR